MPTARLGDVCSGVSASSLASVGTAVGGAGKAGMSSSNDADVFAFFVRGAMLFIACMS